MMLGYKTPGTDHCHGLGRVTEDVRDAQSLRAGPACKCCGLKSHGSQDGGIRDSTEGPPNSSEMRWLSCKSRGASSPAGGGFSPTGGPGKPQITQRLQFQVTRACFQRAWPDCEICSDSPGLTSDRAHNARPNARAQPRRHALELGVLKHLLVIHRQSLTG